MPLYNEEIYFVVTADSPLNYMHEIKDARINAGANGSGTALTTVTLYQAMFHSPLPKAKTTFLSNEDGLVKLTADKSVDVVVIVGGQPMEFLADMKPEAEQLIKFLGEFGKPFYGPTSRPRGNRHIPEGSSSQGIRGVPGY